MGRSQKGGQKVNRDGTQIPSLVKFRRGCEILQPLRNWQGFLLLPFDSCLSKVIRNQQYLYPKFPPTAVVKLLQYSGSRVELRNGFSSYK